METEKPPQSLLNMFRSSQRSYQTLRAIIQYFSTLDDLQIFTANLPKSGLYELGRAFVLQQYKSGSIVFNKGDPTNKLYIVLHGVIDLYDLRENFRTAVVSTVSRGKMMGDRGFLRKEPRSLTAYVRQHSFLISLPGQEFTKIMHNTAYMIFEQKLQFIQKYIPKIYYYSLIHKEKLAYSLQIIILKKNEILVKQGQFSNFVYYIAQGECVLTNRSVQNNYSMMYVGIGCSVADQCVVLGKPCKFTVKISSESAKLYKLSKVDYLHLMPDDVMNLNKKYSRIKFEGRNRLAALKQVRVLPVIQKHKTPKHLVQLASPLASKKIQRCYSRLSSQEKLKESGKQKKKYKAILQKLRDITVDRFYRFNSPEMKKSSSTKVFRRKILA